LIKPNDFPRWNEMMAEAHKVQGNWSEYVIFSFKIGGSKIKASLLYFLKKAGDSKDLASAEGIRKEILYLNNRIGREFNNKSSFISKIARKLPDAREETVFCLIKEAEEEKDWRKWTKLNIVLIRLEKLKEMEGILESVDSAKIKNIENLREQIDLLKSPFLKKKKTPTK
jgi:hypothetical protein